MKMKPEFTPEKIEALEENEIFVFGSNMNGNHAGGAAKLAVEKFGATMGQEEGIQGQSYAIPTLDKDMQKVTDKDLAVSLRNFKHYTEEHPEQTFLLTKIGCGIAGFDVNYMAYMVLRADFPANVIVPKEFAEITGYKGFNHDMTCKGFQYEVGRDYEEKGEIKACSNGFHFCANPFDVFGYYAPSSGDGMNKFCAVKGSGNMSVDTDDTKVACSKIHISAEVGLKGIIDAGVKFIFDKVNWKGDKKTNTGNQSASTNTGYQSASTNTGYQSVATNTGYRSASSVEGMDSIAIVTGRDSKAKGCNGCWIVLTERGGWNGKTYPIKGVKAFEVDGKNIKPDTWYKLIDGEAVEVE